MAASSSTKKIVAEYAKSGRSACKKCGESISASALRLGLVSRDARGFDMTKWHHLSCCPMDSKSIGSAEKINGFALLKASDQEALKLIVAEHDRSQDKDSHGENDEKETSNKDKVKEFKVRKTDSALEEIETPNSKKSKPVESGEEAKLEIIFSTSDIQDNYKGATLLPEWKAFQTIIFLEQDEGLRDSSKIAAFDFDGCLRIHPVGPDAWSLLYSCIPEKLKGLYDDGYKLVIFTNESNIERWKNKRQVAVDSKVGRLNNFIKHVNVPIQRIKIQSFCTGVGEPYLGLKNLRIKSVFAVTNLIDVFIACGLGKSVGQTQDPFRKPKPGMWRIMEQQFNSGIAIDMDQSFYVGDAAGRHNDHSDADIKFAQVTWASVASLAKRPFAELRKFNFLSSFRSSWAGKSNEQLLHWLDLEQG
ncbi:hypothetical protein Syun_013298 [Stephania yunnanensis]|uniref:PARP-type domain-containing protein n=1 Tax=Stephania yunnanensis TaxID=152371 RepID=A0AAP0K2H6_9MAGN